MKRALLSTTSLSGTRGSSQREPSYAVVQGLLVKGRNGSCTKRHPCPTVVLLKNSAGTFVATLPSRSFVEFNVGNALVEEIAVEPFRLDENGCLPVPDRPGLGIDLDRDRLRHLAETGYASETWTWDTNREFEV